MAVAELRVIDAERDLGELRRPSKTSYLADFVPRECDDRVGVLDQMVLDDVEVNQFLPVPEVRESDGHVDDLRMGRPILPPSDVSPDLVRHPDVLTEEQHSVPSTESQECGQLSICHEWARVQRVECGQGLDS